MARLQGTKREAPPESILVPDTYKNNLLEMARVFAEASHGDEPKSVKFQVPPGLASVLSRVLAQVSQTGSLSIVPMDSTLSSFEAAKILGISRPFLISSILNKGLIPYETLGKRGDRRIKVKDLTDFMRVRAKHRSQVLDDLAQMNAEFIITSFDPEDEE